MSRERKSKASVDPRKTQFADFLAFVARRAKSDNVDQYFRNGKLTQLSDLFDCGHYFLVHALGCSETDFIPNINYKEFACFVPQSETYYPWVLFAVSSETTDLNEFYDKHGRNHLLSADSGRKNFAVVTNFRTISVYDLNHHQDTYEVNIDALYDSFTKDEDSAACTDWAELLKDFGPAKVELQKKSRRKEVVQYVEPKETSAALQYVTRFGHMPSFDIPVGYDGKDFRETFKTKELPFLKTESVEWTEDPSKHVNRLIWGDNLAVMRSLPDESIDLIYIDPPFFSGRNYNCIFGDDDEVRSFKDIWDGGMPTYLAWLNARLWEMKRLLKPTGSIFVHLDWHASHYVRCELDKIFGYDNMVDEIIWCYSGSNNAKATLPKKHDTIFHYSKTQEYKFNYKDILVEPRSTARYYTDADGRKYTKKNGKIYYCKNDGKIPEDYWTDIQRLHHIAHERIGYPTQKPEQLLERIIKMASDKGDVVADFFSGGGTTIVTAEKLGRKWLGCDISRIAVSVARDRVQEAYVKETSVKVLRTKPTNNFEIEYHGVYERDVVRELEGSAYCSFILKCYQAIPKKKGDYIHGVKEDRAIYVAPPKSNLRKHQIEEFHSELADAGIQNGVILAWNISKDAEKYVDELRRGSSGPAIQIIQVKLVDIDSNEFKGDNIRFINKPAAVIKPIHKNNLTWIFDATASCGTNSSEIHYYQWDFNYKNRFSPSTKPNFKDADGDGNPLNDYRRFEFTFPAEGRYSVALRIFDKSGAEATHVVDVVVGKSKLKAG